MADDSLKSLAFRLTKRMNRFDARVNKTMKEIVVKSHYVTASGTPADTGQARSNWRASGALVQPNNVISAYVPGKKLGISETQNLNAANAQVRRVVRAWSAKTGKPLYLFNNWPQIDALNNGTISKQGSHFVEAGERVADNMLKRTKWMT